MNNPTFKEFTEKEQIEMVKKYYGGYRSRERRNIVEDLGKKPPLLQFYSRVGYLCEVVRNDFGWDGWYWKGYVKLPKNHPDAHRFYMDCRLKDKIQVHGGLTYGEKDGKFGFDCAHLCRGGFHFLKHSEVMEECEKMAAQFYARRHRKPLKKRFTKKRIQK